MVVASLVAIFSSLSTMYTSFPGCEPSLLPTMDVVITVEACFHPIAPCNHLPFAPRVLLCMHILSVQLRSGEDALNKEALRVLFPESPVICLCPQRQKLLLLFRNFESSYSISIK